MKVRKNKNTEHLEEMFSIKEEIKECFNELKSDPVPKLIIPVVTSALVYTVLSLLWPIP